MSKLVAAMTAVCLVCAATAQAGDPPRFVYVDLGGIDPDPNPFIVVNIADAINDAGIATGMASFHYSTINTTAGDIWVFSSHAFTAAPGEAMVDIATQPEIDTFYGNRGWDINNASVVVGEAVFPNIPNPDNFAGILAPAVMWRDGQVFTPGLPPGSNGAIANAINDQNQIVGAEYLSEGSAVVARSFIWENQKRRFLDELGPIGNLATDINNAGHIVGQYLQPSPFGPYLLRDGEVIVFEIQGQAFALNELDQVVGWPGFIWEEGKIVILPFLEHEDCLWPRDINDFGDIVGDCTSLSAVLWREGKVYKLIDHIQPKPKGQILWRTFGINERGQIVGTTVFTNGSGDQAAFRLDPVTPDFDSDGVVTSRDLQQLLIVWGSATDPYIDLTGDGVVNSADLANLLANWGKVPVRKPYSWTKNAP